MIELLRHWFIKFLVSFLILVLILFIIFIFNNHLIVEVLCVLLGFFISSILFFLINFKNNKRISKKILYLNEIVKKSFPKDVVNRNLYSSSSNKDEFEILCKDVENVLFELKASERMKNDFISSMSHELRTPLTAIKGWAETMKMGDVIDFSTVRRGLDVIINETTRLSSLVNDLLDFSTLASGRLIMNMEKMDIVAEVEESVCIFKEKASIEQKNLKFNDPPSNFFVYGDKSRLKQVFINIIDNALKYTNENGNIDVSISQKDNMVSIEVTDNGCGIEKSQIPKLTQKFFKANTKSGFGIGLSIVNDIVHAHDGTFKILSEKGFGTTVIVSIPLYNKEKN